MSDYVSCAQAAATVRAALKAKGWTSKDVSVRADNYSMGSALRIRIRNPRVPLSVVKAAAAPQERIRYDEYSGEILSGGNRYVDVSYDSDALKALAAPHIAAVREALGKVKGSSSLLPVATAPAFCVGAGRWDDGNSGALWGEHSHIAEGSAEELARRIGVLLLEQGSCRERQAG